MDNKFSWDANEIHWDLGVERDLIHECDIENWVTEISSWLKASIDVTFFKIQQYVPWFTCNSSHFVAHKYQFFRLYEAECLACKFSFNSNLDSSWLTFHLQLCFYCRYAYNSI